LAAYRKFSPEPDHNNPEHKNSFIGGQQIGRPRHLYQLVVNSQPGRGVYAIAKSPDAQSDAPFLLAVLAIPSGLHAQVLYGSLTGNVTDSTGAALPNAKVEALNTATASLAKSVPTTVASTCSMTFSLASTN
jgi:hypothetical protein